MPTLTIRHKRHWFEPRLPHAVFLNGYYVGMLKDDQLQGEVLPGSYLMLVQFGGQIPIGKKGKSIDMSVSATELVEIPQDIVTPVDVSGFVPDGYALISANVNIKKNGSSWRQLPLVGNNGTLTTWIVKVEKNKLYIRSRSAMTAAPLKITGFCRKK